MMKKLILFCVLIFLFLSLLSIPVRAVADCPVCPSGYFWNMNYRACQEGPPGIPNPHYVDPIYVDCGTCQCNPGEGCQSPCDSPPHPGIYTCRWFRADGGGYCYSVGQCARNYRPGNECDNRNETECPNVGPFICVATAAPPPGVTCDICGCDPVTHRPSADCSNCNESCGNCIAQEKSYTAIGCLPTNELQEFVAWLLARAIGIAGGIAFLLMIFAGFQIITSAGDPKRLQAGKEMLTNAIIGLVVIIFSLFLLQLIGVQILKIPGFGE